MFYIIKPAQHQKYASLVDAYKSQLRHLYNKEISDEVHLKTTYIIDHQPGRGVIGGLYLIQKDLQDYTSFQQHAFKPFLQKTRLWEGSGLLFELPPHDPSLSTTAFNTVCRNFYRNIYETFVNFATQQSVDFLVMKMNADEIDDTLYFGFWPYLSNYIPYDTSGSSYYNILSLNVLDYRTFQSQWGRYDRHENSENTFGYSQ